MRLVSWNVNGIRAVSRKGLFDPFVNGLNPDVICLQETKAQQEQSVHEAPGYTEYWYSAEKKGYSGTAILTKPMPLAVTNGLPKRLVNKFGVVGDRFGDPNVEGRVITAEYEHFYLVTVYTPNAKEDLGRLALRHEQWDRSFWRT